MIKREINVKPYFKYSLFSLSVFGLLTVTDAQAQNRYSTWNDPNAPAVSQTEMNNLLKELDGLIRDAERARAADPNFLRDLNSLVTRYQGVASLPSTSSSRLIFKDAFEDGNFTQNPVWTVSSGKYWIEKGYGLRSFVETAATQSNAAQTQPKKLSNEELVIGILGAVLGAQTQNQNQNQNSQTSTSNTAAVPAVIYHDTRLNNAFNLNMALSSWAKGGEFSLQTYQGNQRKTGYRLTYRSNQNPSLKLERIYSSSVTLLGSVNGINLEDEKVHQIDWSRDRSGIMDIQLNGQSMIRVNDQGFRDDFSGVSLTNTRGDFIVKSIEATGF